MRKPRRHVQNAGYFALYELGAVAAPALPRLEVMAQGHGLGKDFDRRVKAKVLIDRIRATP